MTKKDLNEFEKEIATLYEQGKIKFPIHLSDNNELQLIKIFKKYKITKNDWLFSTWRNHFHWLLSGRNPEGLKQQILQFGSMHVYDNKFFTSAIVEGIAPIALGVAWALKQKKSENRVFCFVGCMAARGGLFHECAQYAQGHDLPITYIIEDNNRSVKTNTREVWGKGKKIKKVKYTYKPSFPHAGSGKFVLF